MWRAGDERRLATHRTAFCIIIASFIVQGPFGHPPPLGRIAPTDTVPIRSISCHWCRAVPPPLGRIAPTDTVPIRSISCHWCRAVVWVWRGSCPSWRLASKLYVARSRAIQEPSNRALPLATTPMRWARNTIGAGTIDQGAVTGPMPDLTAPKAFISVAINHPTTPIRPRRLSNPSQISQPSQSPAGLPRLPALPPVEHRTRSPASPAHTLHVVPRPQSLRRTRAGGAGESSGRFRER